MTTTDWPTSTLARLMAAPAPVATPQPIRQATSMGTALSMTTAWVSWTTV